MYFNSLQISLAKGAFSHAEKLAGTYFRLSPEEMKVHKYEVKTLAYLKDHEINDRVFAHLCKYGYQKGKINFQFFRICLQDHRILDAVERADSFIRLVPLMSYIATHELVHIIRFNSGETDFDAPLEEKIKEEEKVHYITRNILKMIADPDLGLVIDCFSNQYDIGDIFN